MGNENARITAIEEKLAGASKQVHDLEGKLVRLRSKRNRLDEQIETEQQQLLQVTEALKQAEGQKKCFIERSKHTSQTASEYEETLAETAEKNCSLSRRIADAGNSNRRKNGTTSDVKRSIGFGNERCGKI